MPSLSNTEVPPASGAFASTRARAVAATLLGGLLLAGCATDDAHVALGAGPAMRDGGAVMPPAGWLDYCSRHDTDPSCHAAELTPVRAQQLEHVLTAIRALPAVDDQTRFGKAEFWEAADRRGGDCEDFALAARAQLLDMGWPKSALRLATAWTEQNEYHLVLTVDVAAAGKVATVVIDRRFPRIESWQRLRSVGYRFVARQSAIGATWVQIDGAVPRATPALRYAAVAPRAVDTASIDPAGKRADVAKRPVGMTVDLTVPGGRVAAAPVEGWQPVGGAQLPLSVGQAGPVTRAGFSPFAQWSSGTAAFRLGAAPRMMRFAPSPTALRLTAVLFAPGLMSGVAHQPGNALAPEKFVVASPAEQGETRLTDLTRLTDSPQSWPNL